MPLVFTYGPDAVVGRMSDRIVGTRFAGTALLLDHRLVFNKPNVKKKGEGLANLEKAEGVKVFGLVFEVPAQHMDLLDGFFGGYGRKSVKVSMKGEEMDVETWIARRTAPRLKPSKHSIAETRRGMEENAAPRTFIEELERIEVLA
jgi:hypothetical protein